MDFLNFWINCVNYNHSKSIHSFMNFHNKEGERKTKKNYATLFVLLNVR